MSRVDLQINDFMLKFQYGVFNPDYPEYNEYNDFILDFDCYLKKEETLESINDNLINMHDIIHSKFETEIKDKLREKMKGE